MHLREWGHRDDVPLVFWHAPGPDASGVDLAPVAPSIADAGYHVLAVNGPGFGRSPARESEHDGLEAVVEALHDLVDERRLERPVLMGHSWGGAVVVRYAGAFPDDVRALVLLDSGHIDFRKLPDMDLRAIAEHEIPTLLLLATDPPHAEQDRVHVDRFRAAVPHAEMRWQPGAGRDLLADLGPPLGDEIASWLVEQGL